MLIRKNYNVMPDKVKVYLLAGLCLCFVVIVILTERRSDTPCLRPDTGPKSQLCVAARAIE